MSRRAQVVAPSAPFALQFASRMGFHTVAVARGAEKRALALIGPRRSIQGWPSGTAKDSEETLAFAVQTGIRPRIETYPLARVADAYERLHGGKARFRAVLTMDDSPS